GAIVFGSLVKGTWRRNSDVDVMLLFNKCNYLRSVNFHNGLKFEIYTMPLKMFFAPFSGNRRNLFFDMFCLQVLKSGEILYERDHLLSQLFAKLRRQKILRGYLSEVLNKAHGLINAAEKYFCRGHIGDAELNLRDASINVARALLIKINVPEINTPRLLIPHIRRRFPEFYKVLREVCGLDEVEKDEAEARIKEVKEMLGDVYCKFGKDVWLKGIIDRAESELLSAEDCLEIGDIDSAMLQAEFAQSIIMKNLPPRLKHLTSTSKPKNLEGDKIKEHIGVLREMEKKYF
ncbi:MAG: nucleotidyltransferase domain-containing protein, partial [Candidatus Bathyarchaeia archaeon]